MEIKAYKENLMKKIVNKPPVFTAEGGVLSTGAVRPLLVANASLWIGLLGSASWSKSG